MPTISVTFSARALLVALALAPACAPAVAPRVTPVSSPAPGRPLAPANLRCEYLVAPLALDEAKPRFSWEVTDPRRGAEQSAYELLVTDASASGKAPVWESGEVSSHETCQIEYGGAPLASFHRYTWRVRTFDAAGHESPWSETATFGTGALAPTDWKAHWIGDATPAPPTATARNGFHSEFAAKEDATKWVQVDLGEVHVFDEIRLYPARPYNAPDQPGFLFPLQFKVWVCETPEFADHFMKVFDETYKDVEKPGTEPLVLLAKNTSYNLRYVRIGVSKLAHLEGKGYAFALAEIEFLQKGTLVSRGAAVSASDSIETGEWSMANLTDGDLASHGALGFGPLPAPMLRKEFTLDAPATRATLFASALGLVELRINGRRVGEDQLAPGWTDYGVRAPVLAYDVTELLRPGTNAIAAQLADGWYAGRLGLSSIVPGGPPRAIYGRKPRLFAELHVEHGREDTIATDTTWRSTLTGPVRSADLLDGETYDARREIPRVDQPEFDDSGWTPAEIAGGVPPELDALRCEPSRILRVLKPVALSEPKPGIHVFDLGQNMVGWCRIRLSAPAGTEISLRHGEVLDADGSLYTANLRSAVQNDRYVARGEDRETFEPRFTCHGFRYVEVTGLPSPPVLGDLDGCVVGNAASDAGTFHASDPLLDRLWSNIGWTLRGNMLSVPTDCPQRDERLGWMGDIGAFAETAVFQRDMAGFYSKWIRDVRDAQADDGRFPDFAPHPYGKNERFTGTPAWGDAGILVPWSAYRHYGDRRLVASHLDAMLRWLEWIRAGNPDLVWRKGRGNDYGDWLNGDTLVQAGWPKSGASTPGDVLGTAYFAHSAQLVSRMAAAVGRADDAKRCRELFEGIRAAFRKAFVAADGTISGNSQGGAALGLAFDLLDPPQQAHAVESLAANIEKSYDGHLSTGFASTLPALMALSERGHVELATKLALDHRFPSWGYAIDNGATTLWERWDGFVKGRGFQDAGMNSFNHYAFGAVGEWMMRVLAGIDLDDEPPGGSRFVIHPRAGSGLRSVTAVRATIRGRVATSWTRDEHSFTLDLTIPANTSATVIVPAKDLAGLTEGGVPIDAAAPNVRVVSIRDGEAVLEVRAGTYAIRSET
ncbi:MAG TPA: family 78 glycoside hydrolase catalytic domain [Planctomycetota bacterium]|nr:family 78 glycoside hydrolase catalytic domain [Planctomycetota bacterium]